LQCAPPPASPGLRGGARQAGRAQAVGTHAHDLEQDGAASAATQVDAYSRRPPRPSMTPSTPSTPESEQRAAITRRS
jgi:hypothetical protein